MMSQGSIRAMISLILTRSCPFKRNVIQIAMVTEFVDHFHSRDGRTYSEGILQGVANELNDLILVLSSVKMPSLADTAV